MPVRPLFSRVIVFHVVNRRRFKSGLFSGNMVKDTLFGAQWVWVYGASENCQHDFKPGDKVLLEDGMALLDCDLNLYEQVKDLPEFADLKREVEEQEADVWTKAVLEGAIIAAESDVRLKDKYVPEAPSSDLSRALHGSVSP